MRVDTVFTIVGIMAILISVSIGISVDTKERIRKEIIAIQLDKTELYLRTEKLGELAKLQAYQIDVLTGQVVK